ncbi:hypothetical protein GIB67_040806, partial [Kingdonia uniflora]
SVCRLDRLPTVSGNSSKFVFPASRCLKLTIFPISSGSLRRYSQLLSFSVCRLDRLQTVSGNSFNPE